MRAATTEIHEQLARLGRALQFQARREVSDSVLALRLDGAYAPRVDLLWSLDLSPKQAEAIAAVTGHDSGRLTHLPVVGIEVEGTTPTTKTIAADVANIAALGTKLGLLVVSEAGERGIYRRATRAVRSLRRSFGDLPVVPMDASWLEALSGRTWSTTRSAIQPRRSRSPAGGESLGWSASTRHWLRELGQAAGFVVVEPYEPEILGVTFDAERRRRKSPLRHLTDPVAGTIAEMRKPGDLLTACQVDLAWLLPLPAALREFLEAVAEFDPCASEHGLIVPEVHGHIAIVGFELESASGKHAAGGLLNLAAYCVIGIGVSPTARSGEELEAVLQRYRPTLGLRNVHVLVHP